MRINVYQEELTSRIEVVRKAAEGRVFFGMRFYLKTHEDMVPPKHGDDDSNAVTFWHEDLTRLYATVHRALMAIDDARKPRQ